MHDALCNAHKISNYTIIPVFPQKSSEIFILMPKENTFIQECVLFQYYYASKTLAQLRKLDQVQAPLLCLVRTCQS